MSSESVQTTTEYATRRPPTQRLSDHNSSVNEHRELVIRKAESLITEALSDTRVVSINSCSRWCQGTHNTSP
jgi:hypothetical protein